MIKKFCDKCGSENNVRTYTINNSCLREKRDWVDIGNGIAYLPDTREYCYKCFMEMDNKVRAIIKEALSL